MNESHGPDVAGMIDAEHRELRPHLAHLGHLAAQLDDLDEESAHAALREVVAFLQGDILPHAKLEDEVLYPVIDGLLRVAGGGTATMAIDHRAIGGMVGALATQQGSPSLDRQETRRLLHALQALLEVHFDKETEVYLPLLSRLSAAESRHLAASLEGHSAGGHGHAHA